MARAVWNGKVIAESDDTVVVEGNHYFPVESVSREFLVSSRAHSLCPWKGVASYYSLEVDGKRLDNAAWYYRRPWPLARKVKNRIAFWHGVRVEV